MPARNRFAERHVVRVDRLDADLVEQLQGGQGADPREPGGGGVEPARVVGEPQRRADVGLVDVLAREPPRLRRHDRVESLGGDGHPRRPARREQPLVAGGDEEVEAVGLERQPARGLRRVDHREHVVGLGRGEDRVEVGDLARGHLHGAEGDGVGVRSRSTSASCAGRDRGDLEPRLGEEREEGGGELDLRHHDAAAGRQRGGDEADEAGDGRADRDAARTPCRRASRTRRGRRRSTRSSPPSSCARRATPRAPAAARPSRPAAAGRSSRCSGRCPRARRGAGFADRAVQRPGGCRTV